MRKAFYLILTGFALTLFAGIAGAEEQKKPAGPPPPLVTVATVIEQDVNPAVEYVLNKGLPYVSGPQWLADHVLQGRWVLAVAGTHGKTSASRMLLLIFLPPCSQRIVG